MLFRFVVTMIACAVGFFVVPVMIVLGLAALALGFASAVLFLCALGSGVEWYLHPASHHYMVNTLGFLGESLVPFLVICAGWFVISEIRGAGRDPLRNVRGIELARDADFDPRAPAHSWASDKATWRNG